MLKFYVAPLLPPTDPAGYYDPYNQRPIISLGQECDDLSQAFAPAADDLREAATACIGRVRQHGYGSVAEFGQDLRECLGLITIRDDQMAERAAATTAWQGALNRLTENHWTRYLFDADAELAALSA